MSEYAPGTPPRPGHFPPRNRIISGLSDLVLVIEARARSGTLITVDMALDQGREVYALPGRVSDRLSDGCNRLIRQGACIATCPEDVLEFFFGMEEASFADTPSPKANSDKKEMVQRRAEGGGIGAGGGDIDAGVDVDIDIDADTDTDIDIEKIDGEGRHEEKMDKAGGHHDCPAAAAPVTAGQGFAALEKALLQILDREEDRHIERIVEDVRAFFQEKRKEGEAPGLEEVAVALLQMKIDGRAEETAAGYYHRTGG